jgi:hypothetical protein
MRIELCTSCRRSYTAEGVCVPCQSAGATSHDLGYYVPPDVAARKPPADWKPIVNSPARATARVVASPEITSAPGAPEGPEPQPHNLDAPGLREPLTPLEARVFDVIRSGGFFTPHCHWSEALIAAKVGVSRRTITRIKPCLVAKGWLRWKRVWRPGSRWQHCVYEILAGWHRPHRKIVMRWLDERRCRADVSLNELPPPYAEKETLRSRGKRVRNGFSRPWGPWESWKKARPPSEPEPIKLSEDFIRRCGGRDRAEAFASWTPFAPA